MSTCENGAPPMYLNWGNITVTTDQKAVNRGIQISMGTPPQIVSLRPSTTDNNLYVVNKNQCAPTYNNTCLGAYGGVFDYNRSDTFAQVSEGQWNGSQAGVPDQSAFIHFDDLLTLGNASFERYPVLYPELNYCRIGVAEGAIPSTVYGLWTGSRSIDHPIDGALVLGGYDTARMNGILSTFASAPLCECCINVVGLDYNDINGSRSLFANSTQTFQISLQPGVKNIYLPQDVWEVFQNVSSGVYQPSLGLLAYSAGNTPTGNLTVTLQGGYETTIPAEELFQYPRFWNEDGEYVIRNNTYLVTTAYNTTDISHSLYWGIPYLTMNYLIGDFKRQQFKMAPAIRSDFGYSGAGFVLAASCDPTTMATASATANNTLATSSASAFPQHAGETNTGVIAGGAVGGGVGLIAIIGCFLFWYIRRRRNGWREQQEQKQDSVTFPRALGMSQNYFSRSTTLSPTELDSSTLGPSELPNSPRPGELDGTQSGHTTNVNKMRSVQTRINTDVTTADNSDQPFEMPAQRWEHTL